MVVLESVALLLAMVVFIIIEVASILGGVVVPLDVPNVLFIDSVTYSTGTVVLEPRGDMVVFVTDVVVFSNPADAVDLVVTS